MTIAYVVARSRSRCAREFEEYRVRTEAVAGDFDGSCLDGEASWNLDSAKNATMVVAFGSLSEARSFFESKEYAEVRSDRAL